MFKKNVKGCINGATTGTAEKMKYNPLQGYHLSNRSMNLKAKHAAKHCTTMCNITRQDFTTMERCYSDSPLLLHREVNTTESRLNLYILNWSMLRLLGWCCKSWTRFDFFAGQYCINAVVPLKWTGKLCFLRQCCCRSEHGLILFESLKLKICFVDE